MKIKNKVKRFLKKNYPAISSVRFKDEEGNHRFFMEEGSAIFCVDMDEEIPFKRPYSSLFYKLLKASKMLTRKKDLTRNRNCAS